VSLRFTKSRTFLYFAAKVTSAVWSGRHTVRQTAEHCRLLVTLAADVPCTRFSQPVFVTLTVTNCSEYSHRTCRALWQGSRSRCSVSQLVPFWMSSTPRHTTPHFTKTAASSLADDELQTVKSTQPLCVPKVTHYKTDPHSDRTRFCVFPCLSLSLSCSFSLSNLRFISWLQHYFVSLNKTA